MCPVDPAVKITVGGIEVYIHAVASVKYTVTFIVPDHGLGVATTEETIGATVSHVRFIVS